MKMSYRKDIDGLRGIAVFLVILDHFGFSLFSGGYIGVDVFFVISGFLITTLIHNERLTNTFSFKQFYIRRIRRLLPAFAATVSLTALVSLALLNPEELIDFSNSAISAIFAFSNIHFWNLVSYFDTAAEAKPLLHTWSLSVEEQFYIIWPTLIILLGLGKSTKRNLVKIICVISFTLLLSEAILFKSHSAAYFLMPARMFEFAIGAFAVFFTLSKPPKSFFINSLSIAALIATISCSILFNDLSRFPGILALFPCFATAILLLTQDSFLNKHVLSAPLITNIGKISYSLYLIHWPVYVFLKNVLFILTPFEKIGGIVFSILLATLFYLYIEIPFRKFEFQWWKNFSAKTIFTWIFLSLFLFLGFKFIVRKDGLTFRFSSEATLFAEKKIIDRKIFDKTGRRDECWLGTYENVFEIMTKNNCYIPDKKN